MSARFKPSRHWTSSDLVSFIRNKVFGLYKPVALQWGEWEKWENETRRKRPIAYFVTEVLPKWLEVIPNHTITYYEEFNTYWTNRNGNTHCLPSRLKVGEYHSMENRILHSLFDSFVDFIEIDTAQHCIAWNEKKSLDKYKVPWRYRIESLSWLFGVYRCPQAGIDRLKYEMGFGNEDAPSLAPVDPITSEMAREQMAIYTWWKEIRPSRGEVWPISGLEAFWDEMETKHKMSEDTKYSWITARKNFTPAEKKKYDACANKKDMLEQQWDDEDDLMIARLMKIRRKLWT
jgi:hypothetical protein